jgi:hypothetical protein
VAVFGSWIPLTDEDGHAYVGHMFSNGVTVLDVRDPRIPKPVTYLPAAPGTWNLHLQLADGLLLVVNAVDLFAAEAFADDPPPEYRAGMHLRRYGLSS